MVQAAGQGEAKTEAAQLAADVKSISDALADEDIKGAFRSVDGGLQMASENTAMTVLPSLYPAAVKPLPAATAGEPEEADISAFRKSLDKVVSQAPVRRGAGPGGAIAEYWRWMP